MNRYALAVAADSNGNTDRGRDSGDCAANSGGEPVVGVSTGTGGDEYICRFQDKELPSWIS